ncbi:unnamed protein product [Rotaria magnacalcarata]|uniref:Uncharacterized protein n=1 Tax=Rotaria magnacalcarata TaxID=392030 RepID=A0A8S3K5I1_9BILA|nr:unnamed protein product [Rotaria magnacalcarata]
MENVLEYVKDKKNTRTYPVSLSTKYVIRIVGKSTRWCQLSKRMQTIQDQIHETSSQNIVVSVDRVFSGSARLDGDAIGNRNEKK